ncbi:MAG: pyruvate kinase [Thermoplasmata archaeon]|nr:pyruvate kinase [Thermoplasmata archaeon]
MPESRETRSRSDLPVKRALICTLGPSSLNERVISGLGAAGVTSFRINMSHTDIADLQGVIHFIQQCTNLPVCLDTEGAQIRTGIMNDGVAVVEGTSVRLVSEAIRGDASSIPLTPGNAIRRLGPGTRMSIDFDSALFRVDKVSDGVAEATVTTGGQIGSRKAVTAFPSPQLPTFSDKDLLAIRMAKQNRIHEYALSFCNGSDAVSQLREMVGSDSTIIAKIESREGVRNLEAIARSADSLLIDRGDLSREVRLEAIPLLQKAIIRKANSLGIPVYVATNLLESMVTKRAPTRAEVNDVINTLLDGANGLVLAAETAIGRYPVEAARMIGTLLREYEGSIEGYDLDDLLGDHPLTADPAPRGKISRS